jgi:hypothetical protein
MSSFLEEQKKIAEAKKVESIEKQLKIQQDVQEILVSLCEKYEPLIMRAVEHNAKKGKMEFYMNLTREDFVIRGSKDKPTENCKKVLLMLTEEGKTLHGLHFNVWNNAKFTTFFSMIVQSE